MTTVNQLHIIQCKSICALSVQAQAYVAFYGCTLPDLTDLQLISLPPNFPEVPFLRKHKASWLQFCIGRDVSVEDLIQIYMTVYLLAGTVPGIQVITGEKLCPSDLPRQDICRVFKYCLYLLWNGWMHLQEFVSIAGMLSLLRAVLLNGNMK